MYDIDDPRCPKCGELLKWGHRWEHYIKCREEKEKENDSKEEQEKAKGNEFSLEE